MSTKIPTKVRGTIGADGPFIQDSWLRSYQHAHGVKKVEPWLYYRRHGELIERLLLRNTVLVACDPQQQQVIWGWVCAEIFDDSALCIHYAYTKELFRGQRIASHLVRMMLDAEEAQGRPIKALVWTHDTKASDKWVAGMKANGTLPEDMPTLYNPYLLHDEPEQSD